MEEPEKSRNKHNDQFQTPSSKSILPISLTQVRAANWVHVLLWSLLAFIALFSLVNIANPHLFWEHFEIVNYPLHSTIESLGAIAAILIALMPLQIMFEKGRPSYVFLSTGFLVMGLWDLFHSFDEVGHGFVFTHAVALLSGGVFFALFVIPWRPKNIENARANFLGIAAIVTISMGILVSTNRHLFPEMILDGEFTTTANTINWIAGALFLIGAIKLIGIYLKERNLGVLILVFTAISSAIVGFSFQYSTAWSDTWWLWHIFRLSAFLALLAYMFWRIQAISQQRNEALNAISDKHDQLLASEEKFRTLFNSVSIPLCHVKEDGRIESINNRFVEHLGYTLEDIPTIEEWWIRAYPEKEYREWVMNNWEQAVQRSIESKTDIESDVFDVTTKDGDVRQIIIAGITIGNDVLATFIDVTEQRKAEQAILREKEFTDSVINAMPGIFYLFDRNGKFLKWNNTLAELSGLSFEEVGTRSPLDFIAPAGRDRVGEAIQTAFAEGNVLVEAEFLAKGEAPIPFLFTGKRIVRDNEPLLVGIGIDIYRRLKAERDKEKALYHLNERMKEISCLFEINEAIKDKSVGISEVMERITRIIPKGWHYPEKTSVRITLDGNEYSSKDHRYSKEYLKEELIIDGQKRGVLQIFVFDLDTEQAELPFLREEKRLAKTIADNLSIYISRIESEEAIRESELNFRNVYSNSPVSIWQEDWTEIIKMVNALKSKGIKDFEEYFKENRAFVNEALTKVVINDVNQATLELFEAEDKDDLVKSLEVVFATEDTLPGFIGELVALAEGKQVYETEMKLNTAKGNLINTMLRMSFPPDEREDGQVLVSIMDISALKIAQDQLQVSMENLQRSNKELERFAYVASHDLQEPLRMVSSYTQLLERRYKDQLDERAEKYIYYAVDGANRMQNLINDLLSFSRISTRGEKFTQTDTAKLVDRVLSDLSVSVEETGAEFDVGEMPIIKADSGQIERLLLNLISNALKFRKPGVKPQIRISAEKQDGGWLFKVADNGIGIDEKFKEKVFVIFQRLHGAAQYKGTGIGLAICKRIIERHGGKIWFESIENEGTTFYFTLNDHSLNSNKN